MENDVLRNKIAPWQEKGRWYHGVFDYTTKQLIKEQTDPLINELGTSTTGGSSGKLFLKSDRSDGSVVDILQIVTHVIEPLTVGSAGDITQVYRYFTAGIRYISIGPNTSTATAGILEFWAFIVEI